MDEILKFIPIYKERIWGGSKISQKFDRKNIISNCGESWEISGIDNESSVVSEGIFKGKNLNELLRLYKTEIVGNLEYEKFPLLIKLLDAKDDLSIQVHPNDTIAKKYNSLGKTEMWHILDAEKGAYLYLGFKKGVDKKKLEDYIENGNILDILNKVPVKKWDTFFIPAGLVHGIGKGIMLLEIQQTSDITYRIYDFNRLDNNGNARELHIQQSLESIDLAIDPEKCKIVKNEGELVSCKYFTTEKVILNKGKTLQFKDLKSFFILACIEGKLILNNKVFIKEGVTVLIPKSFSNLDILSENDSQFLLVRV